MVPFFSYEPAISIPDFNLSGIQKFGIQIPAVFGSRLIVKTAYQSHLQVMSVLQAEDTRGSSFGQHRQFVAGKLGQD